MWMKDLFVERLFGSVVSEEDTADFAVGQAGWIHGGGGLRVNQRRALFPKKRTRIRVIQCCLRGAIYKEGKI